MAIKTIARDISWLSFNARVLQEAADKSVSLKERIKFLGIFSNNLDEFFRVRVATLKRMLLAESKGKMHLENNPQQILDEIQMIVLNQQSEFSRIWEEVQTELRKEKIFLLTEKELTPEQHQFVQKYYDNTVSSAIVPLMIENISKIPVLRDKSIFLAVVMWKKESALQKKYAIIEVPTKELPRFLILPSSKGEQQLILLEDIIRANLPDIFDFFGYDEYKAHIFKMTRDAELDIDNDLSTNLLQKLEKGLKNRKKGIPVRFIYDKDMDPGLLEFLVRRLFVNAQGSLIPGGRIHNFKDFMNFPQEVFSKPQSTRQKPFEHPLLLNKRVSEVVLKRDVMLHLPYHSFVPVINLLREAAFDPDVNSIKITCYRLASQSKIINALINAVRNGKDVTVMLELKARFDEEANLKWKRKLEDEGVKVLIGFPNMKIHGKVCIIKKRIKNKTINYGFVSTGNFNGNTARIYGDHCLLTSSPRIMADINRAFNYLEKPLPDPNILKNIKHILPSPVIIRRELLKMIDIEIAEALKKRPAGLLLKMNSLADSELIQKLYDAAKAGVAVTLIVRGIFCLLSENKRFKHPIKAISIVDEYLEHARVFIFHNKGKEKYYISSADWMMRNLNHRFEVTCPIWDPVIKTELKHILQIQLADNVKARVLDNNLSNEYVKNKKKKVRSQEEIYNYLSQKTYS